MAKLIQIIQIDINAYIDYLWENGSDGDNIVCMLYACRINGIDTIGKAQDAYAEWQQSKGEI